ncbi:MAG: N-sulfoglucosamine sulfohydrolase, partial [Candidatus Paceibacteria bacterium]
GEAPAMHPSKVYRTEECPVPAFLPALQEVADEVASYYSSVRRCDDTVGALLKVLEQTGAEEQTVVVFLSDNGMSFPFAKAGCYLNSTRTPWIVRWPGRVAQGALCENEMISAVDLMPTLLDVAGVDGPAGLDGRSFLELLDGGSQAGRDFVFTQFGQASTGASYPVRCIQSRKHGYIFNPWADGTRLFEQGEAANSLTLGAMRAAAPTDAAIAQRLELLERRVLEELFDFVEDPQALENRIDDPTLSADLEDLREKLESWMIRYKDPALTAFRMRNSPEVLDAFLSEMGRLGQE